MTMNVRGFVLSTNVIQMSATWWHFRKSHGIIKVISIYPQGTINVCEQFNGNPLYGHGL